MLKSLKRYNFFNKLMIMLQPDLVEMVRLGRYTAENLVPRNLQGSDLLSWVPSSKLSEHGLKFNLEEQLALLQKWGKEYGDFFKEIRNDPAINTKFPGKDYLHNDYYPTPDAEIYLSMILDVKPQKIIEVGSGFSTLIARRAVDLGNLETVIEVIDPNPRTSIVKAAHSFRYDYVENIPLNEFKIEPNSIIFIDSSHICRTSGDLPFLYCQLIPTLPSGTMIHVHDVYLPYDYPTIQQKQLYTENYLLHTLLCNSVKFKIIFSSHNMSRQYPDAMQNAISPIIASHDHFWGGSIWFQVL